MRLVLNWDIVQQAILYHHLKKDMGLPKGLCKEFL